MTFFDDLQKRALTEGLGRKLSIKRKKKRSTGEDLEPSQDGLRDTSLIRVQNGPARLTHDRTGRLSSLAGGLEGSEEGQASSSSPTKLDNPKTAGDLDSSRELLLEANFASRQDYLLAKGSEYMDAEELREYRELVARKGSSQHGASKSMDKQSQERIER